MQFNKHTLLEGLHAPFSPSQPSWLRYTDEKAIKVHANKKASEIGTKLHQWAKDTIDLGIKQPDPEDPSLKLPKSKKTLYAYVNDAIGFKMKTEVILFYSERFFGTADSISFRNNTLRIHDLKTGEKPASMEQLEIYAALFCLEYNVKPGNIDMELRLYQNGEVIYHNPTAEDILPIMDHIVHLDKLLKKLECEEV